MKKLFIPLLSLAVAVVLAVPAWATLYYVSSTTGSDSASGLTPSLPFLTIQKCVDTVAAGDTCTVADGTYTDTNGDGIVAWMHSPGANGSVSLPITVKSTNFHGAVITIPGLDAKTNAGFMIQRTFYTIEGFRFTGGSTGSAGVVSHHGIFFESGGSNGTVRRNTFDNISRTMCYNAPYGNTGVFIRGSDSDVLVEYNDFHTIGRLQNGESGCVTSIYQHDHGIYVEATTNTIIRRNVLYDINRGWPVHVYKSGGTTTNITIVNNTLDGKSRAADTLPVGHIGLFSTINGATIKNNISSNVGFATVNTSGLVATNVVLQYNLSDSTRASMIVQATPAGVTSSNNVTSTSPGFVDQPGHDLTLASGSAAIAAGTTISGVTCNGTCDIGAFETFVRVSGAVNANTLDTTWGMNLNTPIQLAAGNTGVVALKSAVARTTLTIDRLTGADSVMRSTFNGVACVGGETWTETYVPGTITDSALIGGTLNQKGFAYTAQAVTNGCGTAPPADPGTPWINYNLDQNTGTQATDSSAQLLHGTLVNSPTWVTGKHGFAVHFPDGGTSTITVPYGSGVNPSTQSLTLCLDIFPDAGLETASRIHVGAPLGTNQRFYIGTEGGTWSMGIQSSAQAVNTQFPVAAGWTFVCMVANSGTATLYVNGVAGTSAQSVKAYTSFILSGNLELGRLPGAITAPGATIGEFRLYKAALSAANILTLFQAWELAPPAPIAGVFGDVASQFFGASLVGGVPAQLGAVNAAISLVRPSNAFAIVKQTDCTGGACDPLGQRIRYSRKPVATGVAGPFLEVPDLCGTDNICFFGNTTDTTILSGAVSCCLSGALTPIAGTTQFTMAAIPVVTLAQNASMVQRYVLTLTSNAIAGDIYYFKAYDQNGNAFTAGTPYTPSAGAQLTVSSGTLAAPTNLQAVGPASNTNITLIWTAVSDVNLTGYHVYQGTTTGVYATTPICTVTPASAAATSSSVTMCTTVVPAAGTYYFVVKAYDSGGVESAASSEVAVVRTGFAARAVATTRTAP